MDVIVVVSSHGIYTQLLLPQSFEGNGLKEKSVLIPVWI